MRYNLASKIWQWRRIRAWGTPFSAPKMELVNEDLTMKFRTLYWIVEQNDGGDNKVTGIYTHYNHVIEEGFANASGSLRLCLFCLDKHQGCMGCWTNRDADTMMADLQKYIDAGELRQDDMNELVHAFQALAVAV